MGFDLHGRPPFVPLPLLDLVDWPPCSLELDLHHFIWSYWVNIDVSLKGGKAFSINLPFPPFKVTNTSDLLIYLA